MQMFPFSVTSAAAIQMHILQEAFIKAAGAAGLAFMDFYTGHACVQPDIILETVKKFQEEWTRQLAEIDKVHGRGFADACLSTAHSKDLGHVYRRQIRLPSGELKFVNETKTAPE